MSQYICIRLYVYVYVCMRMYHFRALMLQVAKAAADAAVQAAPSAYERSQLYAFLADTEFGSARYSLQQRAAILLHGTDESRCLINTVHLRFEDTEVYVCVLLSYIVVLF